jgi:hypothetical protein
MPPSGISIGFPPSEATYEAALAMTVPAIQEDITQQLMLRTLGKSAVVLPFSKQVFLMGTHVAGTGYHKAGAEAKYLDAGDQLVLKREPNNPCDDLAIAVLGQNGAKLGYIPRRHNCVLARLMDAGKQICAEIEACDDEVPWTGIDIKVSMSEL